MATYLGVTISQSVVSGNWLRQTCDNTAADYQYNTVLLPLLEKCNLIRGAAFDSNTMDELDSAESALWLLKSALYNLTVEAKDYKNFIIALREMTNVLGLGTDDSCGQNNGTLDIQRTYATGIYNQLYAQLVLTTNALAEIQAIQDDEVNEEQIQNQLNDAANRINAERLEVDARLQEVRTLEFMNNLQQVLLPLLITSVAVVAFTRKR